MIEIKWHEPYLVIEPSSSRELSPAEESQLNFWSFSRDPVDGSFRATNDDAAALADKVVTFLQKSHSDIALCAKTSELVNQMRVSVSELQAALAAGESVKNAVIEDDSIRDIHQFVSTALARPLKQHQIKALIHLLAAKNSANFSVPGSGKTSVVLAAFEWMRRHGECDSLFVVGPPSCFAPWQHEFEVVLGSKPRTEMLAGGNIETRRSRYYANVESVADLYLTTFQTLHRDWEMVQTLFGEQDIRFFMVVDEAHYIKQPDGAWSNAIKAITPYASRRCILTGTPFPKSYQDGFNLFDTLWPRSSPISTKSRHKIINAEARRDLTTASEELRSCISPLFYRVRKQDLGLTPQIMHDPIVVQMNPLERRIYDAILDRIQFLNDTEYFNNLDTLVRLRRGRIMRLRQAVSLIPLLRTALDNYNEDLLDNRQDLARSVFQYLNYETPAKATAVQALAEPLLKSGEKVLIWSNFVGSLHYLQQLFEAPGHGVRMIYGATPTQSDDVDDAFTRESIISEFKRMESGINVLIANPAACAESISLHTACSHAIYYDLSYNCAQYLQSLDRIHRVGGSETKHAHYYFLQYADSIDQDIAVNLAAKQAKMSALIDEEYPIINLDMAASAAEDEDDAYKRLFKI